MVTIPESPQVALADARELARLGIPIVVGPLDKSGNPNGPAWRNWQKAKPEPAVVDNWRPGLAIAAVLNGDRANVLDMDPRNGGRTSFRELSREMGEDGPEVFWEVATPSGGRHLWIANQGLGHLNGFMPGLDLLANPSLVFLPPTRRKGGTYRPRTPMTIASMNGTGPCPAFVAVASRPAEQAIDANGTGREAVDTLRASCLEALAGSQRGALLHLVHEYERKGYAPGDIVRLVQQLVREMPTYDKRKPWTVTDIHGLLHDPGEVIGDATPAEVADLMDMRPTRAKSQPAQWHSFAALVAGSRKRDKPSFGLRADGQALFYPGKEHTLYGETESGKDMVLVMTTGEALDREDSERLRIAWVDFEEGDEIDVGNRLLNHGLDPALLCDRDWFRFATPETRKQADAIMAEILLWRPDAVILNGVSAAYGLYGWQIKENDSATAYRSHIVRPCLGRGMATISTDHVPKDKDSRGRYALGGVMKLNVVTGSSFLLEAMRPIVRGGEGTSRMVLTKDRPGSVKPECAPVKDPTMRYAGTLSVKSAGDGRGDLDISIIPPQPGGTADEETEIPSRVLEKVSVIFEEAGAGGRSKTTVRDQYKGRDKTFVMSAIEVLENGGYLVSGEKTTRGYKLRSARPWREGTDDKIHIGPIGTD